MALTLFSTFAVSMWGQFLYFTLAVLLTEREGATYPPKNLAVPLAEREGVNDS